MMNLDFLVIKSIKLSLFKKEVALSKTMRTFREPRPQESLGSGAEGRWGEPGPLARAPFTLPVSPQLGEQLKQLVPAGGLTVMDLEVEGVCIRFSPLMTAAGKQPLSAGCPRLFWEQQWHVH